MKYEVISITESFSITLSRKQLFDIMKKVCTNLLFADFPKLANSYINDEDYKIVIHQETSSVAIYKIKFEFKKNILENFIEKDVNYKLVFNLSTVLDEIIKIVLQEKNIVQSANLNANARNIIFTPGDLKKDQHYKALTFDVSISYDSSDDHK